MSRPRPDSPEGAPAPRIDDARLDTLLNAFFDKELGVDESGDLFKGLRGDRAKAREFADTRRFVEELRCPVDAPDQTRSILDAVHARRPWLRDREVWGVRFGRLGLVAALLMMLGGVLLQRNATPDAPVWNAGPAPLTEFVRSSGEATQRTRENATAAFATFRADSSMFSPTPAQFATVASLKPAMPSVPDLAARYSVSFKPEDGECTRNAYRYVATAVGTTGDREIVIHAVGADDRFEYASTVVTFRPR